MHLSLSRAENNSSSRPFSPLPYSRQERSWVHHAFSISLCVFFCRLKSEGTAMRAEMQPQTTYSIFHSSSLCFSLQLTFSILLFNPALARICVYAAQRRYVVKAFAGILRVIWKKGRTIHLIYLLSQIRTIVSVSMWILGVNICTYKKSQDQRQINQVAAYPSTQKDQHKSLVSKVRVMLFVGWQLICTTHIFSLATKESAPKRTTCFFLLRDKTKRNRREEKKIRRCTKFRPHPEFSKTKNQNPAGNKGRLSFIDKSPPTWNYVLEKYFCLCFFYSVVIEDSSLPFEVWVWWEILGRFRVIGCHKCPGPVVASAANRMK